MLYGSFRVPEGEKNKGLLTQQVGFERLDVY